MHYRCGIIFGVFLFPLRHLVNQMCCHVLHNQLHHWHSFQNGDQIFVRRWQSLEQRYDNIFTLHRHLQAKKLICKCLNLVDVVQQIIPFLRFAHEKPAMNKKDVEQTPCLMSVTKDLPCFHQSFAIFNVHILIIRQVECNDGHCLLDMLLVFSLYFGINVGRWSLLGFVNNIPKVHKNQLHF